MLNKSTTYSNVPVADEIMNQEVNPFPEQSDSNNSDLKPGILIVDDDEDVRTILSEYIEEFGSYRIFTASDANEGLDILEKEHIDCIFSDINMPGMDGIEFIRRVKQKDNTISATVITGQPSMEGIIQAMRAGATDFLSKPFQMAQFRISLDRMIKERLLLKENRYLAGEARLKNELADLNRRLEKKVREQAILFAISDALNRTRSTEELYDTVTHMACSLTGASGACFWIVNNDAGKLVLTSNAGMPDITELDNISLNDETSPFARVAREKMAFLYNASAEKDFPFFENMQGETIIMPFVIRSELFGILAANNGDTSCHLGEEALFLLHLLTERASLTLENLLLYDSVTLNLHATLRALVSSLEAKDPYTKEHSERVTFFALKLAREMGCAEEELDSLGFAGHLHDIGKIGIRDHILMKPGKLTREEYEIIKTHPVIGEEIVRHLGLLPAETAIVRHHHERWDGNGYPDGLSGTDIPKLSRILAIADTFDAITSSRPYRKAGSFNFAMEEIKRYSGIQFDPECVAAFERTLEHIKELEGSSFRTRSF
jgi:putative nucleotidyltransferase with HDIG domain